MEFSLSNVDPCFQENIYKFKQIKFSEEEI